VADQLVPAAVNRLEDGLGNLHGSSNSNHSGSSSSMVIEDQQW
jgi:hypothetical protein